MTSIFNEMTLDFFFWTIAYFILQVFFLNINPASLSLKYIYIRLERK